MLQVATQCIANWVEGLPLLAWGKKVEEAAFIYHGREINRYDYKNIKKHTSFHFSVSTKILYNFDVPFQCDRTNSFYDCGMKCPFLPTDFSPAAEEVYLAPEYICHFFPDSLSTDSSDFKSAGCRTGNFGQFDI